MFSIKEKEEEKLSCNERIPLSPFIRYLPPLIIKLLHEKVILRAEQEAVHDKTCSYYNKTKVTSLACL